MCLGTAGQPLVYISTGVKLSVNLLEIDLNNVELSSSGKQVRWSSFAGSRGNSPPCVCVGGGGGVSGRGLGSFHSESSSN